MRLAHVMLGDRVLDAEQGLTGQAMIITWGAGDTQ